MLVPQVLAVTDILGQSQVTYMVVVVVVDIGEQQTTGEPAALVAVAKAEVELVQLYMRQ